MKIKKYVFIGIGVFLGVVTLAIGISAQFTLSNITADLYAFIENFFNQWSPALAATGTLVIAALVFWTIYDSRRSQERDKQQVIHALHDEIHSNLTDIIGLRFQISEKLRKEEKSGLVDTIDEPFQLIDTAVFDSMKNGGQLRWLENIRMNIISYYKLIKLYNHDAGFQPYHLELLTNIYNGLDKAIRDLEVKFTFLPRYVKEKDKGTKG